MNELTPTQNTLEQVISKFLLSTVEFKHKNIVWYHVVVADLIFPQVGVQRAHFGLVVLEMRSIRVHRVDGSLNHTRYSILRNVILSSQ